MNILFIAYSCSPYHGSEDKIGWKVPIESAKNNRVFVITKEEQRTYIERYFCEHRIPNIEFIYVDIPKIFKNIFSGFLYSGRLNIWNSYAFKVAKEICEKENIDIIHQITPVEFRSVGKYGLIPNTKFVCGPIAGGQSIPSELNVYIQHKKHIEMLRTIVNFLYSIGLKYSTRTRHIDHIFFANNETKHYLENVYSNDTSTEVLVDVSISNDECAENHKLLKHDNVCAFAVVGRLVYLKGHAFLFDALERVPEDLKYTCHIFGEGNEAGRLQRLCEEKGLKDKVFFEGNVPHIKIADVYKSADVLIMPSFREATGSVILEAMSQGVPVITINKFGGAQIVNEESGWLYDGNTREEYVRNLANAITDCITNREKIDIKGKNALVRAKAFSWEQRLERYQSVYCSLMEDGV